MPSIINRRMTRSQNKYRDILFPGARSPDRCLFYYFFMRFQWSVNTVENAGIQATKHNDYKRPRPRCIAACFQCSCIELQLHSISMPHPRRGCPSRNCALCEMSWPIWNEKNASSNTANYASSHRNYGTRGKFFASVAENFRVINNIVRVCEGASIEYFKNWIKKWARLHLSRKYLPTFLPRSLILQKYDSVILT